MKNKIRYFYRMVLLLVIALVAVASARVVLIGAVGIQLPVPQNFNAGNIPMRFYVPGHEGDTAFDKTCYTDSSGHWLVEFGTLNTGAAFRWNTCMGTSFGGGPDKIEDVITAIVPQTWASGSQSSHATEFGRGDTFWVDNNAGPYTVPTVNPAKVDSMVMTGSIADLTTGDGITGANITITFHDYNLNHDTIVTTASGYGGGFDFANPFFNNRCYTKCRIHVHANTGSYPDLDTLFSTLPHVWDGNTDTLNADLSLGTHGFMPDTFRINGFIKKNKPLQPPAAAAAAAMYFAAYPDSNTYIDSLKLTTGNDGQYVFNYPNKNKAVKVRCKLTVSATNFNKPSDKFGVIKDSLNPGGQVITLTYPDIVLDSATSTSQDSTDSIVVLGTIKDSSGVKIKGATAKVYAGPDSAAYSLTPTPVSVTADTNGNYSVKIRNSSASTHVVIKVEGSKTGYFTNSIKKDTSGIVAKNAINDTVKMADVKLNPNYSPGDTLFVRGVVDSTAKGHPLQGATVKIFFQLSLDSLKGHPLQVDSCITGANGDYSYKFINSYNNHYAINMIYYKIQLSKTAYYNDSLIDSSFFTPNDWINDTIVDTIIIKKIGTSTRFGNMAYVLPLVKTPVSIYDLSGRLIKSFMYESTGSTTGIPKYLKSMGIRQKAYIMEINGKNGVIRKQIVNLK